jgi:predicted amidohydrolase
LKKIAVVQMRSSEDKQENLKKSIDFIDEAACKNTNLVCFPEFQMAFSPLSITNLQTIWLVLPKPSRATLF